METMTLTVPDMMCGNCSKKIVAAIGLLDAAAKVKTDVETKEVRVETKEARDVVVAAIESVGFEVNL